MSVAIPPAGVHKIPDREYFAIDCPSSSETKVLLGGTNAQLAHQRENPREDTDAFAVGALTHAMLLSPESVETDFIRVGKIDRRTTAGKAEWEAVQRRASLNGARIVTDDQWSLASSMHDAVRGNPVAVALLRCVAAAEITIIGEIAGRPAKAKIDAIARIGADPNGTMSQVLIDIKTCDSASPRDFAASATKFGYWHQAAWYMRLAAQQYRSIDEFIIIAVEKSAPHQVAVYRLPDVALAQADRSIDALAERWWKVAEGDRTGYPETIQELEPPRWWLEETND